MKLSKLFRTLAGAVILAHAALPAAAQQISAEAKQSVLADMTKIITTQAFVPGKDFSKWSEFIDSQKEKLSSANDEETFTRAVNEAMHQFGISHIMLMPPAAAQQRTNQAIVGIGVSVKPEAEGGFRIWNLFPNAPAEESGMEVGDIILKVDGKTIDDIAPITGLPNTQVVITVKKQNGTLKDYYLTRRRFSTKRLETLTMVGDDTAVIKIWSFDRGYDSANVTKLMQQASGKAKNLIVDLRGNGGGAVMNMMHLLGMILPRNTEFGTFVSKDMVERYKKANGKDGDVYEVAKWAPKMKAFGSDIRFTGKVAVLIDGGSASASEIVAAALKETMGAPVIGTKSAGAVLASVIQPISGGFNLQYPLTDYVTVKGTRLEGNGVQPDLLVVQDTFSTTDLAVQKATALLHGADIKALQSDK
jgi:carboxyl-terminal processing protease